MAGVWVDQGLIDEMTDIKADADTWTIDLFTNNATPTTASVIGDFTIATYTGYAQQSFGTSTVGSVSGNNITLATAQKTFAVTATAGSNQVYGYILKDGSGNLIAAEKFSGGPYNMQTLGDTLKLTITETLTRV